MKRIVQCVTLCAFMAAVVMLTGCASPLMQTVAPTTMTGLAETADAQTATVVFVRPSRFGGAIKFGLWDREKCIGILEQKSYIEYQTTPGEHLFLARAENWSGMKADLKAGKNYFVVGRVFPGVWRARVAYDPVTKEDKTTDADIEKWLSRLTPRKAMPDKVEAYATPRIPHVRKAIENFESGRGKLEVLGADDFR